MASWDMEGIADVSALPSQEQPDEHSNRSVSAPQKKRISQMSSGRDAKLQIKMPAPLSQTESITGWASAKSKDVKSKDVISNIHGLK